MHEMYAYVYMFINRIRKKKTLSDRLDDIHMLREKLREAKEALNDKKSSSFKVCIHIYACACIHVCTYVRVNAYIFVCMSRHLYIFTISILLLSMFCMF